MLRVIYFSLVSVFFFTLSACGGQAAPKETDYDATKKMVVDILQTEDGKKALGEILSDEKMQKQLVIDSSTVRQAIDETLASEKGAEMWKKLFDDPKFAETYYKAIEDDLKKLLTDLLKDSEYQKQMLEILQNPEMMEQTTKTLKSQEFRAHLEETIQTTLESPLFLAKIQDILLKAAEEQSKGGGGSGSDSGGEQGGGSGEEGGGGDGGSGGGSGGGG